MKFFLVANFFFVFIAQESYWCVYTRKINVDSRQQETMKYFDVHYTRPPIKGLKYTDTSKAEEMPPSHEPKQAYWQLLTESHNEWCDETASIW